MKKFLAILLAICMMASLLCIPAFAAESADKLPAPAAGTVLRITAIKGDSIELVGDHTNFEDGWNDAMEHANDMEDYGYDRIVVDLYADWNAVGGEFTDDTFNGAGFKNDTIYFNDDVQMTLNMNGHTINRGLTAGLRRRDGEVMYIDTYADVIINNGTITGGGSFNGAGGIHINSKAKVTLNNVNVVGNTSWDDDGGGIALYNGASLVMNGGSIKNNDLLHDAVTCYGGAIYANESSVTLNNVEIKNNQTLAGNDLGAVIYADESTVVLNECTVDGNGIENEATGSKAARSIIHAKDSSSITVKKTTFTNNGALHYEGNHNYGFRNVSTLFYLSDSTLVMENGNNISKNKTGHIIQAADGSAFYVSDTTFTDNNSIVLNSSFHKNDSNFYNCTFNNNRVAGYYGIKITFASHTFITQSTITFYDCRMGNSTYSNPKLVRIVNENLESATLLTLSALKTDGTTEKLEEYRSFEEGWSTAMSLANDDYWMRANEYEAVVVDLHANWVATNGRFTQDLFNGIGFSGDALEIPEGSTLILNMNGHTINRGLEEAEKNGEVMFINDGADVIINDGTITGGFSTNGAGGIHMDGNATLILNNVNLVGNHVEGDHGAAIAVQDNSVLVMNGGSISDNGSFEGDSFLTFRETNSGALYVTNSTATLNNVTVKGNYTNHGTTIGVAICVENNSTVTLNECLVADNAVAGDGNTDGDVIEVLEGSELIIKNSIFTGNASNDVPDDMENGYGNAKLFYISNSTLTMEGGKITQNNPREIFQFRESEGNLQGVTITDNASRVIYVFNSSKKVTMTECTLGNNAPNAGWYAEVRVTIKDTLVINNCDLGDTTYEDKSKVDFMDGSARAMAGSIFGEGSLTMIVALLALIASGVAIFLVVYYNKKKAAPATADAVAETEDEE